MTKSETEFWIKQTGRTKLSDTKPEIALDEIAQLCGFPISKPKPIVIDGYDFRPDRMIRDFYVEADGIVHQTPIQERKTRWRDRIIGDATNKRILHIDAELLTNPRWRFHVIQEIVRFALGDEEFGHVYA